MLRRFSIGLKTTIAKQSSGNSTTIFIGGKLKRRAKSGFTLIEVIIDAFVITVVFGALISSFILVLKTVDSGKLRTVAGSLANEQMENLRNLPYDDLATENGTILPQGDIPDSQTLVRSGNSYIVETTIIYVDDVFDGCAITIGASYHCTDGSTSTTHDLVPVDYKRIDVKVTRPGNELVLANLSSDAAAKAAETPSNTGMLLVIINNALGLPVELADVTVTNSANGVNVVAKTNAQGYVFIANLPPENQNGYHIVGTKTNFSTDLTYTRTPQNPNQFQPDVDVSIQQITTQILAIDEWATLQISVRDEAGAAVAGVSIQAVSSKISQNNPTTAKNTYTQTTDGTGTATMADVEWDGYTISPSANYYIVSTSPYQIVSVDPDDTQLVTLVITTNPGWPRVSEVNPESSPAGSIITVEISGDNFAGNSTVTLRLTGQADILPTSIDVAANQKTITVTYNLTGIAPGSWDVIIDSNGSVVTQNGGFSVT